MMVIANTDDLVVHVDQFDELVGRHLYNPRNTSITKELFFNQLRNLCYNMDVRSILLTKKEYGFIREVGKDYNEIREQKNNHEW